MSRQVLNLLGRAAHQISRKLQVRLGIYRKWEEQRGKEIKVAKMLEAVEISQNVNKQINRPLS